jgi:ABC-type nickel/cobalt efflux system permease component RcnA
MPDWLIAWLGQIQGGIHWTLATELRAGGLGTVGLACALGAIHALTPGHGKAALAAYFLGSDAHITKGLRVALSAALLHVLSGFAIFLVLRLVIGQAPLMFGRNSPTFSAVGYGLIILAGAIMVVQSLRTSRSHGDGAHALTAGIGADDRPRRACGDRWTTDHGRGSSRPLPGLERWSRLLQGAAGALIVAIRIWTLVALGRCSPVHASILCRAIFRAV